MKRQVIHIVIATIGFILSPLTWWNDMLVNVPLAYLFSLPFSLLNEQLFLPSFILGYWLTNLLGFLLLHYGGEGLVYRHHPPINIKRSIVISIIYSVIMVILVVLGWLAPPTDYLK